MQTKHKVASGGAVLLAVSFIMPWEGLWTTAQVDHVGTGNPVTVCYGATKAELPHLKVGDKFSKQECEELLKKSIPKYWDKIAPCLHVDISDQAEAALISAAYNAGPVAVCKSPMIAKMNDGDMKGGCEAFEGWYVRASGRVVKGLQNRREGERKLCLEGLSEKPKPELTFWQKLILILKGIFHAGN